FYCIVYFLFFFFFFFFFQAEDGIRDLIVTGVQTCALPIYQSVSQVELDWSRGFSVDFGIFNIEPTKLDANLFCIKAHYLMKLGTKDQADRNNFRMVKGRLTLDNTNQAKDHKDTLDLIDKEYKKALYHSKNGPTIKGVR